MAHDHRSERPARRGRSRRLRRRRRGRPQALLPPHPAGREQRRLPQPHPALVEPAYLEGYYYKPRLDWELLERHHDGVIATTGCLGGHVLQALLRGDVDGALDEGRPAAGHLRAGQPLRRAAGPRPRRPSARPTRKLVELARRIGARCSPPTTATTPTATTTRPTTPCCACRRGALIADPKRFKFDGDEHFLKSADEMR